MTNSENFFYQFLKEFKGLGIVWEHRYYGKSLPFGPVSRKSKSSQMRFLTVENALKDFVVFADGFKWKRYAVSPKQAPWVFLGGSYPGMRAAMMRQLYPDTVYASYASSAPVQARKDMTCKWSFPAQMHTC